MDKGLLKTICKLVVFKNLKRGNELCKEKNMKI